MPRKHPARLGIGENLTPQNLHETVRASKISRMIAARVRLIREVRGITQPELDEGAGLALGVSGRIESGSRGRAISIDTVVAIASALRIDLMWLITGQGRNPFSEAKAYELEQQILPFESAAPRGPKRKARPSALGAPSQRSPKPRSHRTGSPVKPPPERRPKASRVEPSAPVPLEKLSAKMRTELADAGKHSGWKSRKKR